jgi:hypothetical protein
MFFYAGLTYILNIEKMQEMFLIISILKAFSEVLEYI